MSQGAQQPMSEALRMVGLRSSDVMTVEPILDGFSGADLVRVRLCVPASDWPGAPCNLRSRVVKRIVAETGWLGVATHDTRLREAALWRAGLPQWLPRRIALAAERVEMTEASGEAPISAILLMRDERSHLMRQPFRTPPGRLPSDILALLDALAALHARFWQAPLLDDVTLGLASQRDTLLWLSPAVVAERIAAGDTQPYLKLALRGWEAFFRLIPAEDAEILRAVFAQPEIVLRGIEALPRTLVHGDIWGPNLGALPPRRNPRMGHRLLLLDWSLTTAAPAPYDVLSLFGAWHTLRPTTLMAAYRARLTRRLAAHGVSLAPQEWQGLADAAYLRTALTGGEAWARAAEEASSPVARRQALARLTWWARRGARAAQRLSADA